MALTYKVLGQVIPSGNTDTQLYVVPSSTSTVISTINICNQNTANGNFRISVRQANAASNTAQYIAYDTIIPNNDSISMTLGITLATTDTIFVYANSAFVSFNLFGSEIS